MGTDKEHWEMQFHPQASHASATWHSVHAVSGGEGAHGVLETEHRQRGGAGKGYDASRQGNHHMILGSFNNVGDVKKAAESIKHLKCHNQFPGENCVDWTKKAVEKLHADKHISDAHKDHFMTHYNTHQADVRKNTATAANKAAAGHHK